MARAISAAKIRRNSSSRLNQQEMIGRLQLEPLPQAESNLGQGDAELSR